ATIYEGGCRVVALANWPGRIAAGGVSNELLNGVDLYPTFVGLAGGRIDKVKQPFDGVDVWATISEGAPSPRTEVVYNIEPAVGGIRQGNWKLVWHASLPASPELFDLAEDPSETTNLADRHPDKVRVLRDLVRAYAADPLRTARAKPRAGRPASRAIRRIVGGTWSAWSGVHPRSAPSQSASRTGGSDYTARPPRSKHAQVPGRHQGLRHACEIGRASGRASALRRR